MLARVFAHPASRLALLAATVAATVATSKAPWDWTVEDAVPTQRVALEPGQSVERRLRFTSKGEVEEATGTIEVSTATKRGTLEVVFDELRSSEVPPATRYTGDGSTWTAAPKAGEKTWPSSNIGFRVVPADDGTADVAVKVTNAGTSAVEVTLEASITSGGYDDKPADAAVDVEVVR